MKIKLDELNIIIIILKSILYIYINDKNSISYENEIGCVKCDLNPSYFLKK